MVIELNRDPISDQTERYRSVGLSLEFLNDMAKAISAMQAAGYDPYDQLYGYFLHENDQYIMRQGWSERDYHPNGDKGYSDFREALSRA